jgi:hypothetical protein
MGHVGETDLELSLDLLALEPRGDRHHVLHPRPDLARICGDTRLCPVKSEPPLSGEGGGERRNVYLPRVEKKTGARRRAPAEAPADPAIAGERTAAMAERRARRREVARFHMAGGGRDGWAQRRTGGGGRKTERVSGGKRVCSKGFCRAGCFLPMDALSTWPIGCFFLGNQFNYT